MYVKRWGVSRKVRTYIDICEMKYAADGFKATPTFIKDMRTKMSVLRQYMPDSKGLQAVLVTSNGVIRNKYSD